VRSSNYIMSSLSSAWKLLTRINFKFVFLVSSPYASVNVTDDLKGFSEKSSISMKFLFIAGKMLTCLMYSNCSSSNAQSRLSPSSNPWIFKLKKLVCPHSPKNNETTRLSSTAEFPLKNLSSLSKQ